MSIESKKTRPKEPKTVDHTYGQLQPQDIETEKIVLSSLLIDKDAFSMVSELLCPEAFYDNKHNKIYAAMEKLSLNDNPIDIITVVDQLEQDGTLEQAGGRTYVVELSLLAHTSAHIVKHAYILQKKYKARQLISYAGQITTWAFDETVNVDEVMQEAEGMLFELSQKNMKQDFVEIAKVTKEAYEILQKASTNTTGMTGIPTGYAKLDDATSGWQNSDLVIIAGRPAMGKTSFALSLAKNIAVDYQLPVAFFSLEMSNVQLVDRLISNVCEISGKKILNGQLSPDEWERLDRNLHLLQTAPIYIDDTSGLSIFELRTKARRLVREKGVKIIMIDYMQLMNANGMHFGNRQEEVANISRSLKSLAKELNIPILALSQLNRSVEKRDDKDNRDAKIPMLSDLRESGSIEQDADMVIFVHRPEYYKIYEVNGVDMHGKAQIIIAKHRKGSTGTVTLDFKNEYTSFRDPEVSHGRASDGEILGSRMNGDAPMAFSNGDVGGEAPF